jgi:Trypsin-co-occurring domain 2
VEEGASPTDSLFVRELIRRVHQELVESRAEREASGSAAIFEVERLTVEVNFVATESKDARGGLDFKIVTLGGGMQLQTQQVHKITLNLVAVGYKPDGGLTDLELEAPRFRPREGD